jgi:hypothetical protein
MSRVTLIVFNGTSSPESSWLTCVCTRDLVKDASPGVRASPSVAKLLKAVPSVLKLRRADPLASVVRDLDVPARLPNFDESITNNGRSVGMQAEMIPLDVSIRHQVQASARVQDTSVGSNLKRVENR